MNIVLWLSKNCIIITIIFIFLENSKFLRANLDFLYFFYDSEVIEKNIKSLNWFCGE